MAPHPLAERIAEYLRTTPQARVLDFASGSGRNAEALRAAGFSVLALDDREAESPEPFARVAGPFAAAISTHGLLHGTPAAICARVVAIASQLAPGGLFAATFGSVRDARFGTGTRIDEFTYAPDAGDERGVAHAYFDRERLSALLDPLFHIESLEEHGVDEIAGAWAHREQPLQRAVHWFAIARLP